MTTQRTLTPREERLLATFFARPDWPEVATILHKLIPGAPTIINLLVMRVRRDVWKDLSK